VISGFCADGGTNATLPSRTLLRHSCPEELPLALTFVRNNRAIIPRRAERQIFRKLRVSQNALNLRRWFTNANEKSSEFLNSLPLSLCLSIFMENVNVNVRDRRKKGRSDYGKCIGGSPSSHIVEPRQRHAASRKSKYQ